MLAFSLSPAQYLFAKFTKLLKPPVRKWRSEAKGIVVYLDDTLGCAAGYNNAKIASLQVHADLCCSGFFANESKCILEPTQVISWLGSVINTATSRIAATDERIMSLQDVLNSILSVSSVRIPVRKLAGVYGKIISLTNCVGNISHLTTRNLLW